MSWTRRLGGLLCAALIAGPARAQWSDGFEGYADGSPIEGQGGWHGWDGDDTWFSVVTSNLAASGARSLLVGPGADTVQEFAGISGGKWLLRSQVYVPTWFIGKTYFIALNDYQDDGPYEWAVQVAFDGDADIVESATGTPSLTTAPLVRGAWVELRCEVDLGADLVEIFYDGALLTSYVWSAGLYGFSNFAELAIEAVDLYPAVQSHPHTRELYFDDFELSFFSGPVGSAFCLGDGTGAPCPCGNVGAPGQGCANSGGAGATLSAFGSASVAMDDLVCSAEGLIPAQPALLFVGENAINGGAGIPFGDGLRCAGGNVARLGVAVPDALGAADWGPGLGAAGGWSQGDVRRLQVWYRDPAGSPCGTGFNLSNGLEVTFLP